MKPDDPELYPPPNTPRYTATRRHSENFGFVVAIVFWGFVLVLKFGPLSDHLLTNRSIGSLLFGLWLLLQIHKHDA